MKSVSQLFLLLAAATFTTAWTPKTYPDCTRCVPPECLSSLYPSQTELFEVGTNRGLYMYRGFSTSSKQPDRAANLSAAFYYEGGHASLPPGGIITSLYKEDVIVKIDMQKMDSPVTSILLQVISGEEPCNTALDGFVPLSVKKVTVFTGGAKKQDW